MSLSAGFKTHRANAWCVFAPQAIIMTSYSKDQLYRNMDLFRFKGKHVVLTKMVTLSDDVIVLGNKYLLLKRYSS